MAFTDGVMAVAITLLVLNLEAPTVPGDDLDEALVDLFPSLIAYLLAFRVRPRYELLLLLLFVMAGELNPLIRIYAWRIMLGREGVVNSVLQALGVIDAPIDALLFTRLSVVIVLATTYIPYTTIPIYAALKAVEPDLLEAANDLGSRLTTTSAIPQSSKSATGCCTSAIVRPKAL